MRRQTLSPLSSQSLPRSSSCDASKEWGPWEREAVYYGKNYREQGYEGKQFTSGAVHQEVDWRITVFQDDTNELHIDPNVSYPIWSVRPEEPQYPSIRQGNAEKDSKFMREWLQKQLNQAGLNEASEEEQLRFLLSIADELDDRFREDKKSIQGQDVHPVDVILGGNSHCVGKSMYHMACAYILGFEARHIAVTTHSLCEIKIDGRWVMVENHGANPDSKSVVFDQSALDFGPEYIRAGDGRHKHFRFYSFGRGFATPVCSSTFITYPCSENVKALYPERSIDDLARTLRDKGWVNPQENQITVPKNKGFEYNKGKMETDVPAFRAINQGDLIRRQFYIGNKESIQKITAELMLEDASVIPEDGGDWFCSLNGTKAMLSEEKFSHTDQKSILITFDGNNRLKEQAKNEIILGCDGKTEATLSVAVYDTFIEPHPTPYGMCRK